MTTTITKLLQQQQQKNNNTTPEYIKQRQITEKQQQQQQKILEISLNSISNRCQICNFPNHSIIHKLTRESDYLIKYN